MKLTDRIYLVGSGQLGFNLTSDLDCHVYLVDGGSELALIDAGAGTATAEILEHAVADGLDPVRIRHLLLTHGHTDHAGGTASMRRALPQLCVYAHPVTARYLRDGDERGVSLDIGRRSGFYPQDYRLEPASIDRELDDDGEVRVGDLQLRALETPGHSGGHHAFVMTYQERRVLFAGDLIFHGGRIVLQDIHDCDLRAYARSLRRLGGLGIDALLPGHFAVALQRGQRHIDMALQILDRGGIPPQAG